MSSYDCVVVGAGISGIGAGAWSAAMQVEARGKTTIGNHSCLRFRWRLQAAVPAHYLLQARQLDAVGLTFWDPDAKQVIASEVEFRFAEDPAAWGFVRWEYLALVKKGVDYQHGAMDGSWIDAAYTVRITAPARSTPDRSTRTVMARGSTWSSRRWPALPTCARLAGCWVRRCPL